jgi:NADH-quinone oxidoreductase E subunit
MSVKVTKKFTQPDAFVFNAKNLEKAQKIIAKYPTGRQQSAVLPLLDLAQKQHDGWLPRAAMITVAKMLEMPEIRVFEVATFYTMFNIEPVGKYLIQVCGTTPCWLSGSDDILSVCKEKLGICEGETTEDGMFTVKEVECLGACSNAPMIQISNEYYHEDLTKENFAKLLDDLNYQESRLLQINSILDINFENLTSAEISALINDARSGLGYLKGYDYKGFRFFIKEEENPNFIVKGNKRRYAVALNKDDNEILKSQYSFTLEPDILIEELKLIIDEKNLVA